mgnify:CR=1 FL=1
MFELGPIFRALLRQKVGAILIALQIALTLSIMVNAIFMMQQRSSQMARPSGLDEANLFYLSNTVFGQNYNHEAALADDLRLIRGIPGVKSVVTTSLALGGTSVMRVTYQGDPAALQSALSSRGIR